jgi:hypothetical protein
MKMLLATTGLIGALVASTAASAANFEARALECKNLPGSFLLIVDGQIKPKDDEMFEAMIKKNDVKMAVVGLNSPGGNVLAAYMIGKLIQEKGYTTYVPGRASCLSACAMVWMAGSSRQIEAKSRIGFHGAYVVDKNERVVGPAGAGNALVGSYYAHLGLSDLAILYLTSAGPKEMRWLNPADAKKYDIEFAFRVDEKANYVVGPWLEESKSASNPPPAPPAKASAENDPDGMKPWCLQLLRQGNTSPHCTASGEPVEEKSVPMTVTKKMNNDPILE